MCTSLPTRQYPICNQLIQAAVIGPHLSWTRTTQIGGSAKIYILEKLLFLTWLSRIIYQTDEFSVLIDCDYATKFLGLYIQQLDACWLVICVTTHFIQL